MKVNTAFMKCSKYPILAGYMVGQFTFACVMKIM